MRGFTDGQRRLLLRGLGRERVTASDPLEVDRLAGLVIGTGLDGGWATYQAGQTPDGGAAERDARCRRLARTMQELGETDQQVRDALARDWPADVIDQALNERTPA